ncbi:MAG: hypothetical protein ACN6RK_10195 [Stenotrophomonas sp.]
MDIETQRKLDELIAAQIDTLHAQICKPDKAPATYGRFRAFLYRAGRRHERLMMQTRWYPLLLGGVFACAIMAATTVVTLYFAKGS